MPSIQGSSLQYWFRGEWPAFRRMVESVARALVGRFARARSKWTTPRDNTGERLRVVEKLNLGPRKSLLLVACRGRHFLIANGNETVSAIAEFSAEATHKAPIRATVRRDASWQRRVRRMAGRGGVCR